MKTSFLIAAFVAGWLVYHSGTPVEKTEALLASAADEVASFIDAHGYAPATFSLGEDLWGHDIRYYRVPSGGFVLLSLGSDGRPGGTDDAADLVVIKLLEPRNE